MIDLASAPVKQAQAASDAQSQANQKNIQGLTGGLASILQGIAPGVEQTYNDASARQAAFAKGFSDHLQSTLNQNATGTQSFLQNIVGAPQAQQDQVQSQVAPPGASDTLYGLRGYIPASTLNEEGAAYTANAKMLPADAQAQGLQQISKEQAAQRATDQKFADQLATIGSKAPEYQRQLVNDAFNQAYKTHSANLADAKFGLQQKMDAFNVKYKINAQNISIQKMNQAAYQFSVRTLESDRSYRIAMANLGIKTRSDQRAALAAEYKLQNGGFTPLQLDKFNALLQDGVNHIVVGQDKNGNATYSVPDPRDKTGKTLKPITYTNFVAQAVSHGVPPSLAIKRADSFFPAADRPQGPGVLDSVLGTFSGGGSAKSASVLQAADAMLGTPYVWGGNKPGQALDCSGFVQQAYKTAGINLPRTTYQQVKAGRPVKLNALQPGDAIFTIPGPKGPEHEALYIGNNQVQVSPSTGDVNKIVPLADYLKLGFVAARRYLPGKR
jgi:cell wall-associated NlpC family hydrolase